MFELVPLFPVALGVFKNEKNLDEEYKKIISSAVFPPNLPDEFTRSSSFQQSDLKLLNRFPEVKEMIMEKFRIYVDQVFGFEGICFKLTTSWMTETLPGACSRTHNHKNSYFSGVLYITEDPLQAPVRFLSPLSDLETIHITPSNYNCWNSPTWRIDVNKDMLIFFPSYLHHAVLTHNSPTVRHSVAFNFFPEGVFEHEDSTLTIRVE